MSRSQPPAEKQRMSNTKGVVITAVIALALVGLLVAVVEVLPWIRQNAVGWQLSNRGWHGVGRCVTTSDQHFANGQDMKEWACIASDPDRTCLAVETLTAKYARVFNYDKLVEVDERGAAGCRA